MEGFANNLNYLNHKTKKHQRKTFSADDFIDRFTQHTPEKGFRVIRYYGILANRVRGTLLPIVYDLLNQTPQPAAFIGWAGLLKNAFGTDALQCILCQSPMLIVSMTFAKKAHEIKKHHKELATRQIIRKAA